MVIERCALDLEELLILGDTSSADTFLAQLDGVIQMVASNIVNAATLTSTNMGKHILKAAKKAMPDQYLRNLGAMRYFLSVDNETEYRDTLADRETGLGDAIIEGFRPVYGYGVPVLPVPMMPEANVLFTHPQNIVWGVQRDISVETDKDIRARTVIIVVTLRCDFQVEEEDAMVLVTGVTEAA
jgi:hypothetical protein